MQKFRNLILCSLVLLGSSRVCSAQNQTLINPISLSLTNSLTINHALKAEAIGAGPFSNLSIHAGAMVRPRGAALAGVDVDVTSLSLGNGFHGRLDADAIIKANFGGVNTIFPVTFDQLYYGPNVVGGHNLYYGGGAGAVFGGGTTLDLKLVLGSEITHKFGGEVNVHFNHHNTIVTLFTRIHL